MSATLRLLTRGSSLALAQARETAARLAALDPSLAIETIIVRSTGDQSALPLSELPQVGVFVKELEEALLAGRGDLAVHSLKDLPTLLPAGLEIAAILPREDPRDALLTRDGRGLRDLPQGAVIATSSPRREAQLRRLRPDLRFVAVRGNVDTRIAKLKASEFDALLLALAGLKRLGRAGEASEVLDLATMLPAPGQAAVAIEVRVGSGSSAIVARLDHLPTRAAVEAERGFLLALGGGCSVPVGAHARLEARILHLEAVVAHPKSGEAVRGEKSGPVSDPMALGRALARELGDGGARRILADLGVELPLAARRVLVTRAAAGTDDLARALAARGAEVLSCPAIEIVPPEDPGPFRDAVRALAGFDWLVVTSARAVAALVAEMANQDVSAPAGLRVAAVGPATAAALSARGMSAEVVAEEQGGAGLGRALAAHVKRGDAVFFPRARDAGHELPDALLAVGARLTAVEAYRSVPPTGLAAAIAMAARGGPVDAVVFASPSAVRNLWAAADPASRATLLDAAIIACIGPTTAAAAREAGLAVTVTPDSATAEDLARALARHFGGSS